MCQNRTDSQTPLSGAWAKVQGHATAQLQLSNQSPVMCQLGFSVMSISIRRQRQYDTDPGYATGLASAVSSGNLINSRRLICPQRHGTSLALVEKTT
jgi:hypothetical protein